VSGGHEPKGPPKRRRAPARKRSKKGAAPAPKAAAPVAEAAAPAAEAPVGPQEPGPQLADPPETVSTRDRPPRLRDLQDRSWRTPRFLRTEELSDAEVDLLSVAAERYTRHGELGRGAMGVVDLATDSDLQRVVALKTLLPDEAERVGARAALVREARMAGSLQHPNIVPVHELGRLPDGEPFFTMRRLQGRSLAEVLSEHRRGDLEVLEDFGRVRLLSIFVQICMAVEFAHAHGVVHRDIKPGNIMLGDYGEVLLLDWGIARRTDEPSSEIEVRMLSLTGTPGYMAPEQILVEEAPVSPLSDVYALGAILYEILTLQRPFDDPDPEEVMVRSCSEDAPAPSALAPERAIPPELDEICLAALTRSPEERTGSARVVARQVEQFMEGIREKERRVREADEKVLEGQSLTARYEALRQELSYARKESRELRGDIRPWSPVEHKRPMWELEDRARRLQEEVADAFGEANTAFAAALDRVDEHPAARLGLAHLWWSRFVDEELGGEEIAARQSRAMVRHYDDGGFAARLQGDGRLTLLTDPSRAEVWLYTYSEVDRVLITGEGRLLGETPLRDVAVPMGRHLLVLRRAGFPDVRYPVSLGRLQHHEGYVRFYSVEEIGDGFVYVPGGPFLARGGTTEFGDLEGLREVVLPDFAIGRIPVSFRQYLEFIDALQAIDPAAAEARSPRTQIDGALCHLEGDRWVPTYEILIEGGLREVYPDPEVCWDLPAIAISWDDARAWCAWASEKQGVLLRLPSENEWEKAARGVDGRRFPWGDAYDATFANWRGSRASYSQLEPPGIYPVDVSVYGAIDMCGGASNWCEGWYKRDQGLRAYRGNNWATATARSLAERSGYFPRVCAASLGLRVAKTLKR
jgi:eukaryotic-like serine/threonine-protein kinase